MASSPLPRGRRRDGAVLPSPGAAGAAGAACSRYRGYSGADRWRLAFIRRARRLGFTLGEIRDLLGPAEARAAHEIVRAAEAKLKVIEGPDRRTRRAAVPTKGTGGRPAGLPPVLAEVLQRSADLVGVGDVDHLVTRVRDQVEGVHADEAADHRSLGCVRGDDERDGALPGGSEFPAMAGAEGGVAAVSRGGRSVKR